MKTSDFDYELPQERIAQTPAEPRDSSRLLVYNRATGEKEHRISVDVVPDISVHDEAALNSQLTDEIKALVPGEEVTIVIDHNYSE